jgi:hypothetical protein
LGQFDTPVNPKAVPRIAPAFDVRALTQRMPSGPMVHLRLAQQMSLEELAAAIESENSSTAPRLQRLLPVLDMLEKAFDPTSNKLWDDIGFLEDVWPDDNGRLLAAKAVKGKVWAQDIANRLTPVRLRLAELPSLIRDTLDTVTHSKEVFDDMVDYEKAMYGLFIPFKDLTKNNSLVTARDDMRHLGQKYRFAVGGLADIATAHPWPGPFAPDE